MNRRWFLSGGDESELSDDIEACQSSISFLQNAFPNSTYPIFKKSSAMSSKVILVTGANTGIGFELVRLLAEKGYTVYLGARNEHAGKVAVCVLLFFWNLYILMNLFYDRDQLHADGLTTVKFVRLDVTDAATIHAAKETIEKAEEKLDVLVNNAGMWSVYLPKKRCFERVLQASW
jgi:NAD(P)-dependent dehydrogenase (short-subunit alcohol dehydrogenase family)